MASGCACPTIQVSFPGTDGNTIPITALVDSGATYGMMTRSVAGRVASRRIPVHDSNKPTFVLADGSRRRPAHLVETNFEVRDVDGTVANFRTRFWVVDASCVEVLLGSDFLEKHGATISYEHRTMKIKGSYGVTYELRTGPMKPQDAKLAPTRIYARDTTRIPTGHHTIVEVIVAKGQQKQGAWGLATTPPTAADLIVARGLMTVKDGANWVQVSNMSDEAIVIAAGSHIADFHKLNKGDYRTEDWDIDVEERIARLEREDTVPTAAAGVTDPKRGECVGFSDPASSLHPIVFGPQMGDGTDRRERLEALVLDYRDLWDKPTFQNTASAPKHDEKCTIRMEDPGVAFKGKPRMRAVTPAVRELIKKEIDQQREAGIIEPSASPYSSTVLLIPKGDGSIRFCIDYRALNKVTKKDGYVMPRVDDTLSALQGAKFFTSLDLTSAFWQIPMDEDSKDLTSFSTPGGTWRYNRMPFGLVNGPAIFTRLIDTVLGNLRWSACLVYMDDVLIYTTDFEEHVSALRAVFDRIRLYGLKFKAKKCAIAVGEVRRRQN